MLSRVAFWCVFSILAAWGMSWSPVAHATAPPAGGNYTTDSEAISACNAYASWASSQPSEISSNTVYFCVTPQYNADGSGQTWTCHKTNGVTDCNDALYDDAYFHWSTRAPKCTAGQSSWPTHSWTDGTDCDDSCYVVPTMQVGQGIIGWTQDGTACPYNPNDPTKPQTTPPPPNTPPPPESCNPDGSCTYCAGDVCVTTHPDPPAPPAPPAPSTSGACATATCSTTTGGGGAPGSGSSTGGTGSGTGGAPGSSTGTAPASTSSTTCTTGVCDVGNADGNVGGLYQGSTDTPQSMYSKYMAQVQNAPIVTATTGFFSVQASSSCPTWHIPGNAYWGKDGFDFSFFCSSGMLLLFQFAGFMVLAGGAFCAFRIAIY